MVPWLKTTHSLSILSETVHEYNSITYPGYHRFHQQALEVMYVTIWMSSCDCWLLLAIYQYSPWQGIYSLQGVPELYRGTGTSHSSSYPVCSLLSYLVCSIYTHTWWRPYGWNIVNNNFKSVCVIINWQPSTCNTVQFIVNLLGQCNFD